ncbi:MAG: type II secretion system protein [Methylophaga sp.]|nr:type II secretion system protein [Methylophaga sp.]
MSSRRKQQGFTLIELIITIVLGGIVASITSSILTQPINAYIDSSRRATLTNSAESALRRMQRDIRSALPNSIRISADGKTLELLHIINGGRYRVFKDASNAACASSSIASDCNVLNFTLADTSFDIFGDLQNFTDITIGADKIAVYPLNTIGNNAYAGDNTVTVGAGSTASRLSFSAFKFPLKSPAQRFFIIDTPVSYHCDTSAPATKDKVLLRYQGYAIQAIQATPPTTGAAIQANYIADCEFSYNAGSSSRSGLVTLALTLTDGSGESVRLMHQVHVNNQP